MSLRSIGVMNVLCSPSTTACVISSHSCSICLTRSARDSRSVGCLDHLQEGAAALDRLLSLLLEVGEEGRVVRQQPHGVRLYIRATSRSEAAARARAGPLRLEGLDRLGGAAPRVDDVVDRDARQGAAPVVDARRAGDDAGGRARRIAQGRLVAGQVFLEEFAAHRQHQAVLEGAPVAPVDPRAAAAGPAPAACRSSPANHSHSSP